MIVVLVGIGLLDSWVERRAATALAAQPTVPGCQVADRYGRTFSWYARELHIDATESTLLAPDLGGTLLASQMTVVDLAGLTDLEIARIRAAGTDVQLTDEIFAVRRPTFIHMHTYWMHAIFDDRQGHPIRWRLCLGERRELSALREVSRVLLDDAVVAADPWMGGMFLYVVGPEDTVIHTEKSWGTDVDLVASGLDRVRADPAVCSAVRRERVAYVITGGTPHITAGDSTAAYVGIDDVAAAGGFRVVDRAGPYTLWAVPECPE